MKIRNDYVSNSSSSSFMIVGESFDSDALKKAWLKLYPNDVDKVDNLKLYKLASMLSQKLGLSYECGLDDYQDEYAIGLYFNDMRDDETKRQFLDRFILSLQKAFNDVHAHQIVDGGYDG